MRKRAAQNNFNDAVETVIRDRILKDVEKDAYEHWMLVRTKKTFQQYLARKLKENVEKNMEKSHRSD